MEAMNGWLSFPKNESLNQDMAIRRFCAARVEQEQIVADWEETFKEMEQWSPSDTTGNPHLVSIEEEEEFIDSFINTDCYTEDDDKTEDKTQPCNGFQDNLETFSLMNDAVYEELPIIEQDEFDIFEDFGVASDVVVPNVEVVSHGVDQGLHLVHLLLACAEAVGCRHTQLATSILDRIWASANPWGDSLQRVSFCFAMGLKARLPLSHNVGSFTNAAALDDVPFVSREDKVEAFHFLSQTTPYIAFGFMAANEAICQAAQGNDSIHIIDLGMEHVLQWPSLVRNLASRPEGPPKKLRITGIIQISNLQDLEVRIKAVIEDANTLGIPTEFNMIEGPATPSLLSIEKLDLREGELLIFNSFMHLHKYVKESRGSLKVVLQAIRKLNPSLLTVIEQDANHNGPFFLGRFLESLHYYSAIFDSLEASLPRNCFQRVKIERLHFAEEIRNIVAYEGPNRVERHEKADQWRRQLGRTGFQVVGLKCMSQARMMLSVYGCDGYSLASEKGCMLLGWKGRSIMLASAWQVHNALSS